MKKQTQALRLGLSKRWAKLSSLLWRWSYQRHARSHQLAVVQVWGRR